MPEAPRTLSFRLPTGKTIESYLVQLADGTWVVRTAAELRPVPGAPTAVLPRPPR